MPRFAVLKRKADIYTVMFLMILGLVGVNISPAKAAGEPTFTIQYYSDSSLNFEVGSHLKAGTYYLKITADEDLTGTPTINIDAEGTANDVTDGTTASHLGSATIFKYTRVIASDAAAIGQTKEDISITGTDAEEPPNTATNVNPTNEASGAAYTDTTSPAGIVQINAIAEFTATNLVTLNIYATDTSAYGIYQMQFSNNNSSWSAWETYGTIKSWNLTSDYGASSDQGSKRVYMQINDYAGNVSSYSDDIGLDQTVPSGRIKINNGARSTYYPYFTLNIAATDNYSGVDQMRMSNNGRSWSNWTPYQTRYDQWYMAGSYGGSTRSGTKRVYIQFIDRAGNVSSVTSDTIKYKKRNNKYIIIDLSQQRLYAYDNKHRVKTFLISSGTWRHPTPRGTYHIYSRSRAALMKGPGYYLPNVQWVNRFNESRSIHGTYWHHNFGHPMSHGCINASNKNAKWIYKWAPMGTRVTVRK